MNIVLCESAERREFTAGNKARTDTVRILIESGYKHISLYTSKNKRIIVLFQMILNTIKAFFLAKKDDIVFIQYPYYPEIVNKAFMTFLRFGRMIKRFKICLLIHDSVGLRNVNAEGETLKKELALLDKSDYIICHNESMVKAFKENGGKGNYLILGPFDYMYNGKLAEITDTGVITVCIAGNLSKEKCGYIYSLDSIKNCKFNLYGVGYSGTDSDTVKYKGKFAPEELIEHLSGNFGLVWDGESKDTCTGVFGSYLKYNNPHKLSLYIAAGLPVIVWRQAALAKHVEKMGIGIAIDSLDDIGKVSINSNEYNNMKNAVLKYREELIHGRHLKSIVEKL